MFFFNLFINLFTQLIFIYLFQEAIDLQSIKGESSDQGQPLPDEEITKPGLIHPSEGFIEPVVDEQAIENINYKNLFNFSNGYHPYLLLF